jgi:hypothetical protein
VDAWLGHKTREHDDVDISVFGEDQADLFRHLAGWHLVAHGANLRPGEVVTERWDGSPLALPAHIHARPPGDENGGLLTRWVTPPFQAAGDGLNFEFMLNVRSGDDWLLDREPRLTLPLTDCIRESPQGLPMPAPEVLMFFKATAYRDLPGYPRPRDLEDFLALLKLLGSSERGWLGQAIGTVHPDHAWLTHL